MTAPQISTETLRRLLAESEMLPATNADVITRAAAHDALRHQGPVLAREVLQLREAQGWRPITTAPRGEMIIVSDGNEVDVGYRHGDASWATHWMPLPAPLPEGET